MDFLAVAGLCSGSVAIIGFVAIFVKIGIDKGDTNRRILTVEKQTEKNTCDIAAVREDAHEFEKRYNGSFGKLESSMEYIIKTLDEIKDDLKKTGVRGSHAAAKSN